MFYKLLFTFNTFVTIIDAYETYTLEGLLHHPFACAAANRKTNIVIPKDNNGTIVSQRDFFPEDLFEIYEDRGLECKFHLQTKKRDLQTEKWGLIAVLQTYDLKKNLETDECIDYIQFHSRKGGKDLSRKFCGVKKQFMCDSDRSSNIPSDDAYIDHIGETDVTIVISKESLRQARFEIVFTDYKICSSRKRQDRPCNSQSIYCIKEQFFYDSYVNCPYTDCSDEIHHPPSDGTDLRSEKMTPGTYVVNKVLLGSMSGLLAMFAVFVCCLCCCKHYGKFCWAEDFVNPPRNNNVNGNRSIPLQRTSESAVQRLQIVEGSITGPVIPENAPLENDPNKDLPPSYDSLFPTTAPAER